LESFLKGRGYLKEVSVIRRIISGLKETEHDGVGWIHFVIKANVSLGSIKGGEFHDWLIEYQFVKKGSPPWC
jgi:hypothetical protein